MIAFSACNIRIGHQMAAQPDLHTMTGITVKPIYSNQNNDLIFSPWCIVRNNFSQVLHYDLWLPDWTEYKIKVTE